jgi:Mn2+/Fe2+ NRAMP family transporter
MPQSNAQKDERKLKRSGPWGRVKLYLASLGPGLVTGASDDDPSGIGTYSQTGAQFGYAQLWTALFTFPLMISIQEICARIALQTGGGLAVALRKHYPKPVLYFCVTLLFIANTINLGADLGAMAASAQLLVTSPFSSGSSRSRSCALCSKSSWNTSAMLACSAISPCHSLRTWSSHL